jgi:hypothetical protein
MPRTGEYTTSSPESGDWITAADQFGRCRYDLNALFKKEMGFMTVNVQGLSRVSTISLTEFMVRY